MSSIRIMGMLLLIAGVIAIGYGGFSYTKETHDVDLGPLEIEVEEKEHVNIPLWAGIAAVVAGTAIMFSDRRARL